MPMKTITIFVDVEPRPGAKVSDDCALIFAFRNADIHSKPQVVERNGDITLTDITDDVLLTFELRTSLVEFPSGKYEVSFHDAADGSETLWIDLHPPTGKPSLPDEFADRARSKSSSDRDTVSVKTKNNKQLTYHYAIEVILKGKTDSRAVRNDPQIKNGGNHGRFMGVSIRWVVGIGIAIVACAVAAFFLLRQS